MKIIEKGDLPPNVAERASAVFRRLAEAEAMVHRTSVEDIELHELGEVDTLVDVVGCVIGLEMLGIERLYSSPLPSGSGVIGKRPRNAASACPGNVCIICYGQSSGSATAQKRPRRR